MQLYLHNISLSFPINFDSNTGIYKYDDIEKLKKVYVLTRVLKINDEEFKSNIAIYNNTQNPITSRDMASNRPEQRTIYQKLLYGTPNIYMEYRRGTSMPSDVHIYKHQKTTNEELAQLIYAGMERDPFTAKDKKKSSVKRKRYSTEQRKLIYKNDNGR